MAPQRPTIALAMGDPAGISPELTAKLLSLDDVRDAARLIVIGDRRVFDEGAAIAGLTLDLRTIGRDAAIPTDDAPVFIDLGNHDPADVQRGQATATGRRLRDREFPPRPAIAVAGEADAVFFTPFNKKAMRFAYPATTTKSASCAMSSASQVAASEFNVLGKLWNARVTSHIPLSEVASSITPTHPRGH